MALVYECFSRPQVLTEQYSSRFSRETGSLIASTWHQPMINDFKHASGRVHDFQGRKIKEVKGIEKWEILIVD